MNDLATEIREVCSLYIRFGEELAQIMDVDDTKDSQILVNSILQNRDCLEQITQMNSRVMRLSAIWGKCRIHLDPESRDEAGRLAAAAKMHAAQLQKLCGVQIEKLQKVREDLRENLAELEKGSQFLKSIRPVKNNYPKFIDSSY